MKKITKTLRRCEIVTRLNDDDGNVLFDIQKMEVVLAEKAHVVNQWCFIIHDKDTYSAEEAAETGHEEGTIKPPHIHLLLRFKDPQHLSNIAKWFDIGENFIEKVKGRWEDALKYLIHVNAPDKYQYSIEEVVTNFDYEGALKAIEEKANTRD